MTQPASFFDLETGSPVAGEPAPYALARPRLGVVPLPRPDWLPDDELSPLVYLRPTGRPYVAPKVDTRIVVPAYADVADDSAAAESLPASASTVTVGRLSLLAAVDQGLQSGSTSETALAAADAKLQEGIETAAQDSNGYAYLRENVLLRALLLALRGDRTEAARELHAVRRIDASARANEYVIAQPESRFARWKARAWERLRPLGVLLVARTRGEAAAPSRSALKLARMVIGAPRRTPRLSAPRTA